MGLILEGDGRKRWAWLSERKERPDPIELRPTPVTSKGEISIVVSMLRTKAGREGQSSVDRRRRPAAAERASLRAGQKVFPSVLHRE